MHSVFNLEDPRTLDKTLSQLNEFFRSISIYIRDKHLPYVFTHALENHIHAPLNKRQIITYAKENTIRHTNNPLLVSTRVEVKKKKNKKLNHTSLTLSPKEHP